MSLITLTDVVNVQGSITSHNVSRQYITSTQSLLTGLPVRVRQVPVTNMYSQGGGCLELCDMSSEIEDTGETLTSPDQSLAPNIKGFTFR